jgi:predicted TIM-barrel fold metal-dependent hydrolase
MLFVSALLPARAEEPVVLKQSRAELEAGWRARLQSFLDKGVIPLVDMESTISRQQAQDYLFAPPTHRAMDALGIALVAFDANQAPAGKSEEGGYRWGYHMHEAVNAHPDRYILGSNAGISPNWRQQKTDMITQTESQVRSGAYPIMAEFEFRHFVSQGECKEGRFDREVNMMLNVPNGHRLFALAQETGVPFLIHNEPEDEALDALEEMLAKYPGAKVIQAHFGQIRAPQRQTRFTPEYVRHLLTTYPNLYFDLSVGAPGRMYKCQGQFLMDTVLWTKTAFAQSDVLDPLYRALLVDFSTRFVAGMDYGGGRPPLPVFWEERAKNLRLILRDLPTQVQHNIAYRNAWKLLTGRDFSTP